MAEEVRDDVPAQLSEGEYVVPADVTRYYGVKFFEDLRTEAKQGMAQMEADGRIGGEPVSQTMDNQAEGSLTPEELAMLQEMGMAVGGMVTPKAVGNTGEYNKGGQVLYAQDGVDVSSASASTSGVNPYQAQFTQGMGTAFAPGYLSQQIIDDYQASQAPQSSIVMLYSPDGIAVSVTLPAEQAKYDQLVAEGYTTEPVATTTETAVRTGNDDPPPPETTEAMTPDYTRMTTEELAKAYSQNQTAMAMMAGMAAINPIFGAFGVWATNNTKKKIIEAGYKPPEGGSIFDFGGSIVDGIKNLLGLSEEETKAVVAQVSGGDKIVTPTGSYATTTDAQIKQMQDDRSDDTASIVASQEATSNMQGLTSEEKTETMKKATEGITTGTESSTAADNTTAGGADLDTSFGITGLSAGGFVSKRSKKNKKK
jgi:hypothetical protein